MRKTETRINYYLHCFNTWISVIILSETLCKIYQKIKKILKSNGITTALNIKNCFISQAVVFTIMT